ncbi:hypothetical protein [Streptomyces sp. NPDC002215]|uniref:hypothetical protein n=1 Tax=Streptomyces sp. NPDC002215 TaxID=3154412 RepID=UPI0033165730
MRRRVADRVLEVGDYVQVAAERTTPDGVRPGEGYARVERLERIAEATFLDEGTGGVYSDWAARRGITAVFCQGMPGPVLLRPGDHWILTQPDAQRREWDEANPTWTGTAAVFAGGVLAQGSHPHRDDDPPDGTVVFAGMSAVVPRRRATVFGKPSVAVRTGDYLQLHAVRHPASDMGPDEGFHRVEWVAHLAGPDLSALVSDTGWACGILTLMSVHGLSGTLILPQRDVAVLVAPNRERVRYDEEEVWHGGPFHAVTGMVEPSAAELAAADSVLRPCPPDDEADLYPSLFKDPGERARFMDGVLGVRPVATSLLPWPHGLFKCAYKARWERLATTYPDGDEARFHIVHAELFSSLTAEEFAACPYHQANWPAIVETALAYAAAEEAGDHEKAQLLYAMEHLDESDRLWARDLLGDHLMWSQGSSALTNGQHRLCAMREANVKSVPVHGRHLPSLDAEAVKGEAGQLARQTVKNYWAGWSADRWGSARLGALLARYPKLRRLLVRPHGR